LDILIINQINIDLFSDSSSPETLLHLRHVADDGEGWIQVVLSMVRVIPLDDSLGSITILVILDDCPLPDKVFFTNKKN